jgi:collagen triple helix repeat protein
LFSHLKSRVTYANVVVTLALILAMTGFAAAAIPDAGGAIHACYDRKMGTLRVIKAVKSCSKGEKSISWNQQGRSGRDGSNGANGSNGTPGTPGTNGVNGTNGTNGATNVTVNKASVPVPTGNVNTSAGIACSPGQLATGGGFNSGGTSAVVTESSPSSDGGTNPATAGQTPNGWHIVVHSSAATTGNIEVICASP